MKKGGLVFGIMVIVFSAIVLCVAEGWAENAASLEKSEEVNTLHESCQKKVEFVRNIFFNFEFENVLGVYKIFANFCGEEIEPAFIYYATALDIVETRAYIAIGEYIDLNQYDEALDSLENLLFVYTSNNQAPPELFYSLLKNVVQSLEREKEITLEEELLQIGI